MAQRRWRVQRREVHTTTRRAAAIIRQSSQSVIVKVLSIGPRTIVELRHRSRETHLQNEMR